MKYANNMQIICKKYAKKYARNMPKYADNVHKTSIKYAIKYAE